MAILKIKQPNGSWAIVGDTSETIKFTEQQLTEEQKKVARENIGAKAEVEEFIEIEVDNLNDFVYSHFTNTWNRDPLKSYKIKVQGNPELLPDLETNAYGHYCKVCNGDIIRGELLQASDYSKCYVRQTLYSGIAGEEHYRYYDSEGDSWTKWTKTLEHPVDVIVANTTATPWNDNTIDKVMVFSEQTYSGVYSGVGSAVVDPDDLVNYYGDKHYISYDKETALTDLQKTQARENIGAAELKQDFKFIVDGFIMTLWTCEIVDQLPTSNIEPLSPPFNSKQHWYFLYDTATSQWQVYGYVNNMWLTIENIIGTIPGSEDYYYAGFITDYWLPTKPEYYYKTIYIYDQKIVGPVDLASVGRQGLSIGSEAFNSLLNIAGGINSHAEGEENYSGGYASHAEGQLTTAYGDASHTEGYSNFAQGYAAHAEGRGNNAEGDASHAEGITNDATGAGAHAEGCETDALGSHAHSEGYQTVAEGDDSHAEGCHTIASGGNSHAEGIETVAVGNAAHVEGNSNRAEGGNSHAEGYNTIAKGDCSHVEGDSNISFGASSHVEGHGNKAYTYADHAEGNNTRAGFKGQWDSDSAAHSEGMNTHAEGKASHSEGDGTYAQGDYSHTEGICTRALGQGASATGYYTLAAGSYSHAEGQGNCDLSTTGVNVFVKLSSFSSKITRIKESNLVNPEDITKIEEGSFIRCIPFTVLGGYEPKRYAKITNKGRYSWGTKERYFDISNPLVDYEDFMMLQEQGATEVIFELCDPPNSGAIGISAHSEGRDALASGDYSHAEGSRTTASGDSAHAEGVETTASGHYSHAEGYLAKATGHYSHAEGYDTTALDYYAHAEGNFTIASKSCAHAEGYGTKASGIYQHVQGRFNIEDTEGKYAHIVGNGQFEEESNAHTLDWQGNAWFAGDVYVGSTSGTNKDEGSKKLIAEDADGNVSITGNLTVKGTTYTQDNETLRIADNIIELNSTKTDNSTTLSGLAINKDETSTYGVMYDPTDDTVKFGEGSTINGVFTFGEGEGAPIAVRDDSSQLDDGAIMIFDKSKNRLVNSGYTIDGFKQWVKDYIELYMSTIVVKNEAGGETLNINTDNYTEENGTLIIGG